MQTLSRGWQEIGRPVAGVVLKIWAGQRLDLALAITVQTLVPGGLGVGLSRGVRLLVAARMARSAQQHQKRAPKRVRGSGSDSDDEEEEEEDEGPAASTGGGGKAAHLQQGAAGSSRVGPAAPPSKKPPQPPRPAPKGLGGLGLPAVPLPPLLPPECSTQPIGLPMMLVGQSAARAPMYAMKGDRLMRGLVGLAATFLVCRAVKTPFTGRLARLPPHIVEYLFHSVVGPAAAVSYITTSAAGQTSSPGDRALCQHYKPTLQHLYIRLRAAGEAEAERDGRGVVFASNGPSVEAIQRSDVNACCLPGGIVFVHSGLIKAVDGRQDSLAFVLGHEVGHAIGRHSLEKATQTYMGMFAVDTVVGLAQRFLQGVAPGEENEAWIAGRLKTLDGLLQSGLYLLQLGQSRRHEYEADQLAVALGSSAGMSRCSLLSGAGDTLRRFMKLEAHSLSPVAGQAAHGDSPLSTHPAAANRLRRLTQMYGAAA